MIKTIVCPTDFSPAAQNGTQYAAKLAQLTGARLYFVHVVELTPLEATVTALSGRSRKVAKMAEERTAKLEELCRDVNSIFGVSAEYEVDASAAPFHRVFSGTSRHEALLVSGTNGEDHLLQRLFGSASYQILKDWDGPVLIIPENVTYGTIRKLVYAWGEHIDLHFSLDVLKDFIAIYDPAVICLHVAEPRSLPRAQVYEELRDSIEKTLAGSHNILYERIDSDDVAGSLGTYMKSSGADLLALNHRHVRGTVTPLKHLAGKAEYPFLVIPA